MNISVSKGSWKFERKGSHTFCVARANIRVWEDDSEALRLIDLKASGVAVCNKLDEYNLDFGKALAQSRADKRLDRKIEKFLVKLSEKNGKKKIVETPHTRSEEYKLDGLMGYGDRILSEIEMTNWVLTKMYLKKKGVI